MPHTVFRPVYRPVYRPIIRPNPITSIAAGVVVGAAAAAVVNSANKPHVVNTVQPNTGVTTMITHKNKKRLGSCCMRI